MIDLIRAWLLYHYARRLKREMRTESFEFAEAYADMRGLKRRRSTGENGLGERGATFFQLDETRIRGLMALFC